MKTLTISKQGAKFDGFKQRFTIFFNHSIHITMIALNYNGSGKPGIWITNDIPSFKEICKVNKFDVSKYTYVFYGHKVHGGIAFYLYKPDEVKHTTVK